MINVLKIPLIFIIFLLTLVSQSCNDTESEPPAPEEQEYRVLMRTFVKDISSYAKGLSPDFVVIPQNGVELVVVEGDFEEYPETGYLNAIDGVGQEDLFFGYDEDDLPTPPEVSGYVIHYLDIALKNNVNVLVTDYCSTISNVDTSYKLNAANGFVSFAADHRELDNIPAYPPAPVNENDDTITKLSQIQNFLYLIDPGQFASKQEFINSVKSTNYDLLITDCFFNNEVFTPEDLKQLKQKANGGIRLVISYMSIGEAEDYRYYWKNDWETNPPSWLKEQNPDWEGNYKVEYWNGEWQKIIFGNDDSYLKKILNAGFDGVYLDIIDAFEYFEEGKK